MRVNKFRQAARNLFIDARKLGRMIDRVHRKTNEDIQKIAAHITGEAPPSLSHWERVSEGRVRGESHIRTSPLRNRDLADIRAHGRADAGRYVGAEEAEDDGEPFEQKMKRLTAVGRTVCTIGKVGKVYPRNLEMVNKSP